MKKTYAFLSAILYCLLSIPGNAQTNDSLQPVHAGKWSIQATGGYGFAAVKVRIGTSVYWNEAGQAENTKIRGTYGTGSVNTIDVGYRFTQHLSVRCGFFVNQGASVRTYDETMHSSPGFSIEERRQAFTVGSLVGIGSRDTLGRIQLSLNTYFMCGYFNTISRYRDYIYDTGFQHSEISYTGGVSFGWLSSATASYILNDHWAIGVQQFFLLHFWKPTKGEVVAYRDGTYDWLPNLSESDRKFGLSNEPTYGNNGLPRYYKQGFTAPLHAIGAGVTVSYSF